nr:type II secretion system F family protein [Lachnospiraceae bacterium]
ESVACVRAYGMKPPICFARAAALLLKKLCRNRRQLPAKTDARMEEEWNRLYPGGAESPRFCYQRDKLAYALMIVAVGTLLSFCMCVSSRQNRQQIDRIARGGYGSEQTVELTARLGAGKEEQEETVRITVAGREYTKEEIEAYMEQIRTALPDLILGENADVDHVTKSLTLMKQIDDNPVMITWSSSDYGLMDSKGTIQALEIAEEGELCMLTATLSCQGYEEEERFYIRICRGERTEEEQLKEALREALQYQEEENRTDGEFMLPQEIGGNSVIWIRKENDNSVMIMLFTGALAVGVYFALDRDLQKQIQSRKNRLLSEYPEFVSRLVLLLSAGMTMRSAMYQIAGDHDGTKTACKTTGGGQGGKNVQIYEEIVYTCHELDSGIPEAAAYYHLGRRCGEQHYVRLCMLLSQNLKKGTAGLLGLLKAESADAFEERKRNARRLGEEAGTKLLLPMMIMLLIVMMIIMVPAFMSFST